MIIEIAGKPAEHIRKSLEEYVMGLNKVKDLKVHSIKVSDPKEIESSASGESKPKKGEEMFTCFAEVDFETENFSRLSEIMFDFMPSSVEVIEPSNFNLGTSEVTDLLNNISGRLHRYDEISKIAHARILQLNGQVKLAQKLLLENNIIDAKGKILKKPDFSKTKKEDSSLKKKAPKKKKSKK